MRVAMSDIPRKVHVSYKSRKTSVITIRSAETRRLIAEACEKQAEAEPLKRRQARLSDVALRIRASLKVPSKTETSQKSRS